jgi:hypothetical protein
MFRDDDPRTYVAQSLTLNELRDALKAAKESFGEKESDIAIFKDCYMATLELAGQLEECVKYAIASPALVPAEGWPYKELFEKLRGDQGPHNDEKIRKRAVGVREVLRDYYAIKENRKGHEEVPFTVLDIGEVATVVKCFFESVQLLTPDQKTFEALDATTTNAEKALLEAGAFAEHLFKGHDRFKSSDRKNEEAPPVAFRNALGKLVVSPKYGFALKSVQGGPSSHDSDGSSRQTPASSDDPTYGRLGIFCYPFKVLDQRRSLLASNASYEAYSALELGKKDEKDKRSGSTWHSRRHRWPARRLHLSQPATRPGPHHRQPRNPRISKRNPRISKSANARSARPSNTSARSLRTFQRALTSPRVSTLAKASISVRVSISVSASISARDSTWQRLRSVGWLDGRGKAATRGVITSLDGVGNLSRR